jgi:hypothetical protein
MTRARLATAAICFLTSMVLGAACLLAQGPLPGDVGVTRLLQSLAGGSPAWAELLTHSAKSPGVWLTLCIALGLGYARGGWWGAAAPPLALLVAHLVNALLRALIFAPKPSPELVAVATASSASGIPSTFALVYGALFGAVIFARAERNLVSTSAAVLSGGLIVLGTCARLILGGHWTSQILASLLLIFSLVIALELALRAARRR